MVSTPALADRGTASNDFGFAILNAAGTPNRPFVEEPAIFQGVNNIIDGRAQAENGDTLSSAQLNIGFGRGKATTAATAFIQPEGTSPGDVRFGFIDPFKSAPLAISRVFTYDFLRINTAATGPLFATFRLNITGDVVAASNAGTASVFGAVNIYGVFADTNVLTAFSAIETAVADGDAVTAMVSSFDGDYVGILPFTNAGVFNPFQFELFCSAALDDIGPAGSGNAACNNLIYTWNGIDSVRDAKGNLVTDFSVSSSSGFDYTKAFSEFITAPPIEVDFTPFPFPGGGVPEPATWSMMIIGFGLVGAAMRRRVRLDRSDTGQSI